MPKIPSSLLLLAYSKRLFNSRSTSGFMLSLRSAFPCNPIPRIPVGARLPPAVQLGTTLKKLCYADVSPLGQCIVVQIRVPKGQIFPSIEFSDQPVEPYLLDPVPLMDHLLLDRNLFRLIQRLNLFSDVITSLIVFAPRSPEALGLKKGSTLKLVRIPSGIQVRIPKEETRPVKEVYALRFKRTGKPEWASAGEIKSIWKDTE